MTILRLGLILLPIGTGLTMLDLLTPGDGSSLGYWLDGLLVGMGCMATAIGYALDRRTS